MKEKNGCFLLQELSGGCVNVVVSRKEFALVFSHLKNGMKLAFVCLFIKCGFKTVGKYCN